MEKAKINIDMVWPFLHTFALCNFSLSTLHEGQQGIMTPSKEMSNIKPHTRLTMENRIEATGIYLNFKTLTLAFLNADVK